MGKTSPIQVSGDVHSKFKECLHGLGQREVFDALLRWYTELDPLDQLAIIEGNHAIGNLLEGCIRHALNKILDGKNVDAYISDRVRMEIAGKWQPTAKTKNLGDAEDLIREAEQGLGELK